MIMLNAIADAAREAGAIVLRAHDAAVHQKEGHFNFVTDADVAVQNYLKTALLQALPEARFFSEEQENEPLTDAPTFVVDPIDGTLNFMRNRRASAVSIGLLKNKAPVMAAVYNPYADEMFTAEQGKGAFCNGKPIHVSASLPENALVAMGTSPYDPELAAKSMAFARDFLLRAGDIRRVGAAALDLADVACGRADVYYELRIRPWDAAAGSLLVTEAGGRFYSLGHAQPYYDDASGVLAVTPACDAMAREILAEVL
ncbi:MAG: inositol monophosphatase [Clostridia bacterium]|nr:inositol monophosphatase [Clostridia bacterium]MBR1585615.1 inositol monophosphatase [Clostridia bacterium]